jgi:hypothetical protein
MNFSNTIKLRKNQKSLSRPRSKRHPLKKSFSHQIFEWIGVKIVPNHTPEFFALLEQKFKGKGCSQPPLLESSEFRLVAASIRGLFLMDVSPRTIDLKNWFALRHAILLISQAIGVYGMRKKWDCGDEFRSFFHAEMYSFSWSVSVRRCLD